MRSDEFKKSLMQRVSGSLRGARSNDAASEASYFVVFYDSGEERSVVEVYASADMERAISRFRAAELAQARGELDSSKQIVFFGSKSLEMLEATHPHYFFALGDVGDAGFWGDREMGNAPKRIYRTINVSDGEAQFSF